ncbi:MAG TPA: PepSY-like domain-containing protein [Chitinophagaceae bacterium]|nr:PepSY-like domain-containing protein [Chitinophagaceae bacterium]
MKLRNLFIIVTAIGVFAACKPSYKATDKTKSVTDSTSVSTTGTPSTTVNVPEATRTAFTTQYPTATNVVWVNYDTQAELPIDWELTGWQTLDADDYVVRFDMDNENYYAWYDNTGTWVGSAYVMKDITQLPEAVNKVINEKYTGYTVKSVNREFQKDRMAYEVELTKPDGKAKVLVDSNGTIIKEKTKPI